MSANGTAEENTQTEAALANAVDATTTSDTPHTNGAETVTSGNGASSARQPENEVVDNSGASSSSTDSADDARATTPRPAKSSFTSSPTALQDMFLNGLRRENIDVVIYFCDGSQERGAIRAFDTFTVLLENRNSGKAQLIYKHAISRIFPTRTPSQLFSHERANKK